MKDSKRLERVAKGLTILSFAVLCWVAHRATKWRTDCVHSTFINLVLVDGERVFNCRFESRLELRSFVAPISFTTINKIRKVEDIEELSGWLPLVHPVLTVELVADEPDLFQMNRRFARIGERWLEQPAKLKRMLVSSVLNAHFAGGFASDFEREVVTDFLLLTLFSKSDWPHAPARHLNFATVSPTGGLSPLVAVALARVFEKLPMREQFETLSRLRRVRALPALFPPQDPAGSTLADWFDRALKSNLISLGVSGKAADLAIKRTLNELDVSYPTRWELTVDLTLAPAWREIYEQLRTRSRFFPKERTLVFTPEGAFALPSGLPVEWAADDVSSQKHVLVACNWPDPDQVIKIRARKMFAEHSCGKLKTVAWD